MDPGILIPTADALPASPFLFRVLLDLTFAIHLLLMNVMMGLAFVGLWRSLREPYALGHVAGVVPTATALAVNVGVAPLLFLQLLYGQFFYVSSALMGLYWFSVVLAAMAAYALAYRQKYLLHRGRGPGVALWALVCLLLLYVSFVQTNNAVLLLRPDLWAGYLDNARGTMTALADPSTPPRWLHFVTASIAVGGLALAMIGRKHARTGDQRGPELERQGLVWLGRATVVQAALGVWFLMSLPAPVLLAFMGGEPFATGLFAAGLAGAGCILAFSFKGRLAASAAALAATVSVMVVIRDAVRSLLLAPLFNPEHLPRRDEPSTAAMFFGCLAVSLAVVWWAGRMPAKDANPAKSPGKGQ